MHTPQRVALRGRQHRVAGRAQPSLDVSQHVGWMGHVLDDVGAYDQIDLGALQILCRRRREVRLEPGSEAVVLAAVPDRLGLIRTDELDFGMRRVQRRQLGCHTTAGDGAHIEPSHQAFHVSVDRQLIVVGSPNTLRVPVGFAGSRVGSLNWRILAVAALDEVVSRSHRITGRVVPVAAIR